MSKHFSIFAMVPLVDTAGLGACAALLGAGIGLLTLPLCGAIVGMFLGVFFSLFAWILPMPYYANMYLMHQRLCDSAGHAIAGGLGAWTGTYVFSLTATTLYGALAAFVVGGVASVLIAFCIVQQIYPYKRTFRDKCRQTEKFVDEEMRKQKTVKKTDPSGEIDVGKCTPEPQEKECADLIDRLLPYVTTEGFTVQNQTKIAALFSEGMERNADPLLVLMYLRFRMLRNGEYCVNYAYNGVVLELISCKRRQSAKDNPREWEQASDCWMLFTISEKDRTMTPNGTRKREVV